VRTFGSLSQRSSSARPAGVIRWTSRPDGSTVTPCPAYNAPANPFSSAGRSGATCWSKINGDGTPPGTRSEVDLNGRAGFSVSWQFPMLIAAIDPQAEARLDGLNHALTSGRYLPENFGNANPRAGFGKVGGSFPVLAAADSSRHRRGRRDPGR
jgi:hypothetical protein